jgi:hypothetical protein
MLKTVVGIPGDRIAITDEGVSINGLTLTDSAPRLRSTQYPEIALPVLRGEVVLQARQYWVYGGGSRLGLAGQSFDSRYFGSVWIGQIRSLAIPIYNRRPALICERSGAHFGSPECSPQGRFAAPISSDSDSAQLERGRLDLERDLHLTADKPISAYIKQARRLERINA